MAFNNWPWTSLQNLNLDWILNKVKEALTKSEEAKTTANGIAGTANSALTTANNAINLANGAIELAEQAREIAEEAGRPELPAVDSNDYGKLLGVDLDGEWDISEYPQQVVGISENTNDVSITLRTVGGAFPQTVNVAKSDASRYYIDFTVNSDDISQISSVTSNRTYTEILNAYAIGKHVIARIKYNTVTLFESDTMRLFNPSGSVQAFQFLLGLSVSNGVGKYTYAFVNSNNAVNVLETTLPSGGGSTGIETAVYGTTPASDIYTWFNAGKSVRCVYGNNIYWLVQCFQSSGTYTAYFAAPIADGLTTKIYYLAVSTTTWTNASVNIGDVIHYSAQSLTNLQKAQARINIGASAETIRETVSGTSATLDAEINTMYLCGTMTALTIDTFPPTGIFSVVFTSGSTATTLTVPNTLHMQDGFTVEANKRYEINVLDGYAVVAEWGVSP